MCEKKYLRAIYTKCGHTMTVYVGTQECDVARLDLRLCDVQQMVYDTVVRRNICLGCRDALLEKGDEASMAAFNEAKDIAMAEQLRLGEAQAAQAAQEAQEAQETSDEP